MAQTQSFPIVLVQSRGKVLAVGAASLLCLMTGQAMTPHHTYIDLLPAEWVLMILGGVGVIWALVNAAKPNRLIMSSLGVQYFQLFSERSIPWSSIRGVGTWGTSRNPNLGVLLALSSGGSMRLAGGWPLHTNGVVNLIMDAQRQAASTNRSPARRSVTGIPGI